MPGKDTGFCSTCGVDFRDDSVHVVAFWVLLKSQAFIMGAPGRGDCYRSVSHRVQIKVYFGVGHGDGKKRSGRKHVLGQKGCSTHSG